MHIFCLVTDVENSSAKFIEKPALLFVMRSGILRRTFPICMVKKEFTVNQDLKALVPYGFVLLEYLFYVCKSNEREILNTCMKNGTTVESINAKALFDFVIFVPTLPEQVEIVRILDIIIEKENKANKKRETRKSLFFEFIYLNVYYSAFRVKRLNAVAVKSLSFDAKYSLIDILLSFTKACSNNEFS